MDNDVNRPSPPGLDKQQAIRGAGGNDAPNLEATDAVFEDLDGLTTDISVDRLHLPDNPPDDSFGNIVQGLKTNLKNVNHVMPQELHGVEIPRAEMLYASRNLEAAKKVVILMPEKHASSMQNPLDASGGISAYSAKVLNCHILKEIYGDEKLGLKANLHESSVKMGPEANIDFDRSINDVKVTTFAYANHISLSQGQDSIPFEDPREELKFLAQNFTFYSMLFTEARVAPEKKAFTDSERSQLMQQFGFPDMNSVGMRMSIIVNDLKNIAKNSGLDDSALADVFREVEAAIEPHSYISINHQSGVPDFDFQKYADINPNARRAYFNHLNSLVAPQALVRDEAAAKKIQALGDGVYSMVIGAMHVPNIIAELEQQGIAVCALGAEVYHDVMDVDIRQADFQAKLNDHKQAVRQNSDAKLTNLRQALV